MDRHSPAGTLGQAVRLLGGGSAEDVAIRQAAWVARCVGRGENAPLTAGDVKALAATLHERKYERGARIFGSGDVPDGIWIVQQGRIELSVGSGRRRTVVHVIGPGFVDGDVALLLDMPLPYQAHAVDDATLLWLSSDSFEHLLATQLPIARRWLSSIAQRLAASQMRIVGLLGRTLNQQLAQLLLDEAHDNTVSLPQRTLAAMLGVQRPSLNKVLKEFERHEYITVRYGAIDITDRASLAKIAD